MSHLIHSTVRVSIASLVAFAAAVPMLAQSKPNCTGLPDAGRLKQVVQSIVKQGSAKNGGMGNQEWATVVNRDGVVCAIIFSGTTRSDEWPGSRVISAEKANTANGLSGRDYALSTANVYAASQPGQSLYSLTTSAPPNPNAVFGDPANSERQMIQWWERPLAGSLSSPEACRCIRTTAKSSEAWASVATSPAPTT